MQVLIAQLVRGSSLEDAMDKAVERAKAQQQQDAGGGGRQGVGGRQKLRCRCPASGWSLNTNTCPHIMQISACHSKIGCVIGVASMDIGSRICLVGVG